MKKINLQNKFNKFNDQWSPKVIEEMNDYQFKLVKIKNDFTWHKHEDTDETFFVIEGKIGIEFEDETIELSAGEMIIYPSTQLHSVAEVKDGERHVCVGWIQSYIQNNEDRNFLFGLDAGAKGLLAKHGRSDELDLVFQAYSNLLRRLGD